MKVIRTALLLSMGFGLLAPFTRAETPAPAKPAEPVAPPAVKAAPKMEDPTVPAIKGKPGPENGFLKRHEGFLKDKTEILAKGPIQFLLVGDSITDGWRNKNGKETYDKTKLTEQHINELQRRINEAIENFLVQVKERLEKTK